MKTDRLVVVKNLYNLTQFYGILCKKFILESFPFAEERRLFYVALTRAKVKSYMVVVDNNKSTFAKEMEQKYEQQLKRGDFTCPLCGGRLEKKTGPYGDFYGCSNYKSTGCTFKRKINKKEQG